MRSDSGQTVSVWMTTADTPPSPPLPGDRQADVCVVGAGIAGMTTAYLLACEGRSVIVLDDGPLGGGETCRTTAHLSNALDDRYWWIEEVHGAEGARLAAESHGAAIDRIESIVSAEGIDCGFERLDGFLFNPAEKDPEDLSRELEAARRAGLAQVELLSRAPVLVFDTGPCLRFPRQGQFHPLRYLAGLAAAIRQRGGLFFSAHADGIEGGPPASVATSGGASVRARSVVVATNSPVHIRFAIHTKQAPYRTYAIAAAVPPGSFPRALLWETGNPYHYIRIQGAGPGDADETLIVGGEDHKTGQEENPEARLQRLEQWARERFPMIREITHGWSGQVLETVDGLAYIGPTPGGPENVFLATGDSGMGMTHGTIAGILLTDLLCGRENPWTSLYDPSRISLRAAGEFARENVNVALQYADYLSPSESAESIAPGEGAVLRRGARKIAAWRDERGTLHEKSAICPHLGCVVAWNRLEKTWDCPCHGSRFDVSGRVVNGPATGPLADEKEDGRQPAEGHRRPL